MSAQLYRPFAPQPSRSEKYVLTLRLFQRPVLMIAVNSLFHDAYSGMAGFVVMWMRMAGGGTETTVEQALMRGLVTA